jgi:rod shape-determining protein MreC
LIDIRRRTTYFFLLVSLGHVLLISAQVQSKSGLPLIEHVAFTAFAGVQRAASALTGGLGSLWDRYVALHGVVAENTRLRAEITQLQGRLQEEAALAGQSRSLEAILRMQTSVSLRTLAARVIAGDPAPGSLTITIDRGSADGLRADLGVIALGGVVGRVMGQLMPHAARVQLLTGRNAGAGALLERAGAEGAVTGGGDSPLLRMLYVPNSYDVQTGDRVVTSGHDRVFPPGFAIGTVEQAQRGNTTYKLIAIRPSANFSHLDVVLVLLDPPPGASAGGGL